MQFLSALARQALHQLLPVDCGSCGVPLRADPVPFFCSSCWQGIRPLHGPFCPRCGRPFPAPLALARSPSHVCGSCRAARPSFTRAWSPYAYDGCLRDAIRLFKYRGKVALRAPLARLLLDAWPDWLPVDLLLPVPLHPTRLREREFNQALLLADAVGRSKGLPVAAAVLARTRVTRPQVELTRAQRRKSLRRTFAVQEPQRIKGKRILLIDDVLTTGTTVNECAKALRKAGSADVFVVTLARTL